MHWTFLESAEVPDGSELRLYQRGGHFMIRAAGTELMASHNYASEQALASLACQRVGQQRKVRFLVGGLGMGYTLGSALRQLRSDAEVVVAELVPAVVRWNRQYFGHLAEFPLDDPRVRVVEGDVAHVLRDSRDAFDAVLLDVDNGPEGLTRAKNDWLYGGAGLRYARMALRPDGVLAVWSAGEDDAFSGRLERAGYSVEVCRGHKQPKQRRYSRHVIWLATPDEVEPAEYAGTASAGGGARAMRPAPRGAHGRRLR
jgi:spermidine synthase